MAHTHTHTHTHTHHNTTQHTHTHTHTHVDRHTDTHCARAHTHKQTDKHRQTDRQARLLAKHLTQQQTLSTTDFLVPTVCVAGATTAAAVVVMALPGLWLCAGDPLLTPSGPRFPDLSISSKNGRCWGLTSALRTQDTVVGSVAASRTRSLVGWRRVGHSRWLGGNE